MRTRQGDPGGWGILCQAVPQNLKLGMRSVPTNEGTAPSHTSFHDITTFLEHGQPKSCFILEPSTWRSKPYMLCKNARILSTSNSPC